MNDADSQLYLKLVNYVHAATDLAEAVEADIKAGRKMSSKTVLALSKFAAAAGRFKNVTDTLKKLN